MEKVTVSADALRQVLNALIGAPHLIRELQATRDKPPILTGNPIDTLLRALRMGDLGLEAALEDEKSAAEYNKTHNAEVTGLSAEGREGPR